MSELVTIPLWYLMGVLGCVILWRLDKKDPTWCPTPRAILLIAFASVLGVAMLITSIIVYLVELGNRTDNWFTRPICKRKDRA